MPMSREYSMIGQSKHSRDCLAAGKRQHDLSPTLKCEEVDNSCTVTTTVITITWTITIPIEWHEVDAWSLTVQDLQDKK